MFFDILKSEKSCLAEYDEFYKDCIACETKVRTDPYTLISKARTTCEEFVNIVLRQNGVEIPTEFEAKREANLDSIQAKILRCAEEGFINEFQQKKLDFVRKNGNRVLHPTYEDARTPAEIFRAFYLAVVSYATGERIYELSPDEKKPPRMKNGVRIAAGKEGYETEDLLPIGEYEVIKPLFENDSPPDKIKTYRCKKLSVIEDKTEEQYAIIRRFRKHSDEDIRQYRDIMAMSEIKRNYANLERPPILAEEISTSSDCPYRYLCYITSKDTFLLSQKKKVKAYFSSRQCETEEEMLLERIKILSAIVEILYDLIDFDENKSLHHRNLRPDCVFITPNRRGCSVSIGNFEYSKVQDSSNTVPSKQTLKIEDYAKQVKDDPYAPSEIKMVSDAVMTAPDWEQVDIYSVAKLALYLVFGNAKEENLFAQLEELRKRTCESFYRITRDIIENPYPTRPTFKEYRKAIKEEMFRLEQ